MEKLVLNFFFVICKKKNICIKDNKYKEVIEMYPIYQQDVFLKKRDWKVLGVLSTQSQSHATHAPYR